MKFTVITITYNAAACLQRTLDSVRSQTYTNLEHLLIDGSSTDNTLLILADYKMQSRHDISIYSEPDKGLYDAMNKGLQKATGDYVIFMNAGDTFANASTLETVAKAIAASVAKGSEVAVAYGETLWTDNEGRVTGRRNHSAPSQLSWRSFKQGMLVCHQAFYARTDIARMYSYNLKYRHSADIDWCINVMKEAEKRGMLLVNVNEVVAHYQREGQTTRHHWASLKERFAVMREHYGLMTTILEHVWFVVRGMGRLRGR